MRKILTLFCIIAFMSVLSLSGCSIMHHGNGKSKVMIKDKGSGHPGKGKGNSKTMIKIQ